MKENGKTVRCPECGSTTVIAVPPFDWIKMCMDNNCVYYLKKSKKWRHQFST